MAAPKEVSFSPVADRAALEELWTRSHDEPVILFKHSATCPISSAAYEEMAQLAGTVALVVVQRARDISREIEARTGLRHESPQAILLRNGQAVWSTSHWNVTAQAVEVALDEYK